MNQNRHPFNGLLFQDNWGKPAREIILDFNEARDDGVAVASVGPCANYLHLAQTHNQAIT